MSSFYTNLYTELIEINKRYIFGEFVNEEIELGNILVNSKKPDDINMSLNFGDVITVHGIDYKI